MLIKVCGLTARTPLDRLASLPVHWGGLILVESSPRYAGAEPFELPLGWERVGVFRDASAEEVLRTAERWRLDHVQLHGREPEHAVARLRRAGYSVVKAVGVGGPADLRDADRIGADYLLFDRPGGGTGEKFDWAWLDAYAGDTPFLLAGGIGPDDAAACAAVDHPRLAGFDLNSRFETAPGVKDFDLLNRFLHQPLPR